MPDETTDAAFRRRIRRGTAVQATADVLREEILGHLGHNGAAEEWLLGSEDEVLERLGVSRPTLRQAVRLLEAEQLLVVRRGIRGGLWGHSPSAEGVVHASTVYLRSRGTNLLDVTDAFAAVGTRCLALAAENPDPELRQRLLSVVDELVAAAANPLGGRTYASTRLRFYREVARMVENPVIRVFFDTAIDLVATSRRSVYLEPEHLVRSNRFFLGVARSIAAGDAAGTERRARTFFIGVKAWMHEQIELHGDAWARMD
jgi:GntR family transcriptional repressor for pyruvate dehydrogenase complex